VEGLKDEARSGVSGTVLPAVSGLSTSDYAFFAEATGWSIDIAPEVLNCSALTTGNMEILHLFGNGRAEARVVGPAAGRNHSIGVRHDEPDVASSDADEHSDPDRVRGDELVISGRKWWITGAADPRARFSSSWVSRIRALPDTSSSPMVLVPRNAPG